LTVETRFTALWHDFLEPLKEHCQWNRGLQVGNHWPNLEGADYSLYYLTRDPLIESTFYNLLQISDMLETGCYFQHMLFLTCKMHWTHVHGCLELPPTTQTCFDTRLPYYQKPTKFLSTNFGYHAPIISWRSSSLRIVFLNAVVGLHPKRIVSHMTSHRVERVNGPQINRFPEVLLTFKNRASYI